MKKTTAARLGIYLIAMVVLAFGLVLNTKSGLGTSAIISVPYTVSEGFRLAASSEGEFTISLGDATLILYCLFVAVEFILKGKKRTLIDILQIPLSIVFTRLMDLFKAIIPYQNGFLPMDLLVLVLAIVITGAGAAATIDMQLIPNPGDGFVAAIAQFTGKELGFVKNCVDLACVLTALLTGLAFGSPLLGVGLGTVLSMFGVGRSITVFNRNFGQKLKAMAGLTEKIN